MAAAGLVALFRSCMDTAISIVKSQKFGAEYELLCAELSLQCLRFRLWEDVVGHEGNHNLPTSIINRKDIQPTFDQVAGTINYLLEEAEELRKKYQLTQRPSINHRPKDDLNPPRSSKSLGALSSFGSSAAIRQRMRKNQKQKSFLVITKWSIYDARQFQDKVRKLRGLIDDLEDVTKAAGFSQPELDGAGAQPISTTHEEDPPPYSAAEPLQQLPEFQFQALHQSPYPRHGHVEQPSAAASDSSLSLLAQYVSVMKRFLCSYPNIPTMDTSTARSKIRSFHHSQFQEFSEDVHDELVRRQQRDEQLAPKYLPRNAHLHSKRNEARKKLASLHAVVFPQLLADVVAEFDRRYPNPNYKAYCCCCASRPLLLQPSDSSLGSSLF